METEPTWSHSSTDFSGLFNLSNTTTESSIGEETFKWTNAEIARLIQIIIRPILIILGTVGNCLTLYIMRRPSLKDVSSCFYMTVLAVADTGKSCLFLYKNQRKRFTFWVMSLKTSYFDLILPSAHVTNMTLAGGCWRALEALLLASQGVTLVVTVHALDP